MEHNWHRALTDARSPLSMAAYVAMAVVWLDTGRMIDGRTPELMPAFHAAMALFLGGYLFLVADASRFAFPVGASLMALMALGIALMGRSGTVAILFVLVSAVLAAELRTWPLVLAILANNVLLALITLEIWGVAWGNALLMAAGVISFQGFAAMVMRSAAESARMSETLRTTNAELLATRSLLTEGARDHERLRLARDLHDVAGHKLTALKLNLAALSRDPAASADPRTALCAQLADELLADIRGVVHAMRRQEGIDLAATLQALGHAYPRPRLELELAEDARPTSLQQAEAVLRTVQEGLVNAARHSQAQTLWVVLRRDKGTLRLDLRDDGRGSGPLRPGNGLRGMRERLEAAGGGLEVDRTGTGGVRLQAWLPAEVP